MLKSSFKKLYYESAFSENSFVHKLANELSFTFAHEMVGLKNENDKSVTDNVRYFRDVSTDVFVKTFLNDDNLRYLFLDYTFHAINTELQTKINEYLDNNNQMPLIGDEKIIFVFKGGNVMNVFMKAQLDGHIENIFKNILFTAVTTAFPDINPQHIETKMDDKNASTTYQGLFDFVRSKFLISDVDYSVYIKASNYARFVLIHGGILKLLATVLSNIAIFFEELCDAIMSNLPLHNIDNTIRNTTGDDNYKYANNLASIRNFIVDKRFEKHLNLWKYITENNTGNIASVDAANSKIFDTFMPYDDIFFNELATNIKIWMIDLNDILQSQQLDKQALFLLIDDIQYMQTIRHVIKMGQLDNSNNIKIDQKLNEYYDILNDIVRGKQNNVAIAGFYTRAKFDQFKTDLQKQFKESYDKDKDAQNKITKYEAYNTGLTLTHDLFEMLKPPDLDPGLNIDDISFAKRNDFILGSKNNPIFQNEQLSSSPAEKLHYITYNNIINFVTDANHINFDLMRIKFNIQLNENCANKNNKPYALKVPSEFIDVSIPKWADTALSLFLDHNSVHKIDYQYINNADNTKNITVALYSYDLEELFSDLIYVLFSQNYFAPWLDKKYEKRIIRCIFLGLSHAHNEDFSRTTPGKLNNDVSDIFLYLIVLSDKLLTYCEDNTKPYPYDLIAECLDLNFEGSGLGKNTLVEIELGNIIHKYKHIHVTNLLCMKDKYNLITDILMCIINFSYMYYWKGDDIIKVLNKYRKAYKYVPYKSDNINTVKEIVDDFKKNLNKMLKLIIDVGIKFYYIYYLIRFARASQNLPPAQVGGFINVTNIKKYEQIYHNNKKAHNNLITHYNL